jgi:hypothetical protein
MILKSWVFGIKRGSPATEPADIIEKKRKNPTFSVISGADPTRHQRIERFKRQDGLL